MVSSNKMSQSNTSSQQRKSKKTKKQLNNKSKHRTADEQGFPSSTQSQVLENVETLNVEQNVDVEQNVEQNVDVQETDIPQDDGRGVYKKKTKLTREELDEQFSVFLNSIQELGTTITDSKTKKLVKNLLKDGKTLKQNTLKTMKKSKSTTSNTKSGFMKPVRISKEMASFAGWNEDDLRSRVDVTRYIWQYIQENNLQNPNDKRQFTVDKKLSKLLSHSPNDEPLTYPRLQKKIQYHFVKE